MPEDPAPRPWFVVRTHSQQEVRAELNLRLGGIETFLPIVAGRRFRRNVRAPCVLPMFPQYLFARFEAQARFRDVSFARGVQTVLRSPGGLSTVDDSVVSLLRSRMDTTGVIRTGEPLRSGEKVAIEAGPFAALVGVVERVISGKDRVVLLLTAVQATMRVDIAVDAVRKLPATAVPQCPDRPEPHSLDASRRAARG
jgi:transcriptional antiterminator RfaH